MKKEFIFISSSSDLSDTRRSLNSSLKTWLIRHDISEALSPYLWELDTDSGRKLSDRISIQEQLLDPLLVEVPFVICLFGERIGVVLETPDLSEDWEFRIKPWRCGPDGAGLVHPWPTQPERQKEALESGGFPLTGTVFELISALHADATDNVVLAYVANKSVSPQMASSDELIFNEYQLRDQLYQDVQSKIEEEQIYEAIYRPQTQALFNLIRYLHTRNVRARRYPSSQEMLQGVLSLIKNKLRQQLRLSADNPFKHSLEHWTLDDVQKLPGRDSKIEEVIQAMIEARANSKPSFILIKGRSGCGKSSLLQKGVLGRIKGSPGHSNEIDSIVLPFRPTELDIGHSNQDILDVLWNLICCRVEGCYDPALYISSRRNIEEKMADRLINVLDRLDTHLYIGVDQFEEIIDELYERRRERESAKGWWLVIRFLRAIAKSHRVNLIATLESSRWKTFERLKIEEYMGLQRRVISADISPQDIENIARSGFYNAGLELDDTLVEEIKTKWEEFDDSHARDGLSASPLPLVCLWLSQLYDRFDYLATNMTEPSLTSATDRAFGDKKARPKIDLDDLGEKGVAFEHTISRLAEEAWKAAGRRPINSESDAFDAMTQLTHFLKPLVSFDADNHLRLLSCMNPADAENGANADRTTRELFKSFINRRLIVPAMQNSPNDISENKIRYRLVHQSVIDRWRPARFWRDQRWDYLRLEYQFRTEAGHWSCCGKSTIRANDNKIQNAATILYEYRANWPHKLIENSLESADEAACNYALKIFTKATDPLTLIESSSINACYVHLASAYHLDDLLRKFITKNPDCVNLPTSDNRSSLDWAAWADGSTVSFLLNNGAINRPGRGGWYPITAAIQNGANQNYLALAMHTDDLDAPAGPNDSTPLMQAAYNGNDFVVNHLLDHHTGSWRKDEDNRSALHWSAWGGNQRSFLALLSQFNLDDFDAYGYNPLTYAASKGYGCIIRAALSSSEVENDVLERTLAHKNKYERTPLMEAAFSKHPEVVRLLLQENQVIDPIDQLHQRVDGDTLLHLALTTIQWESGENGHGPTDEEKVNARKTVEAILKDGRIDPMTRNKDGLTAFDVGKDFAEARAVLREAMPADYGSLTMEMRILDLNSKKASTTLRLLHSAPQALTDIHGKKTGLQILLNNQNIAVIIECIKEGWIGKELLNQDWQRFCELATSEHGSSLRDALIPRLDDLTCREEAVKIFLNAAISDHNNDQITALLDYGANSVIGTDTLKTSVFHQLAIEGKVEEFKQAASVARLNLPLDTWNRRPSDVASQTIAQLIKEFEQEYFNPASAIVELDSSNGSTKFHEIASRGDIRAFLRQARGSNIPLPLDKNGMRPSMVAPEELRSEIARIEDTYFKKVN